jgi:hypothetical protein
VERKLLEPFRNSLPAKGEWLALSEVSFVRSATEEVDLFDCDVHDDDEDDDDALHYHRRQHQ